MQYPDDMDAECIPLCDALNALGGIATTSSCSGHGRAPHRIFFVARTVESLGPILRCSHSSAWRVEAGWANGSDTLYFLLEGPVGSSDTPGGANDLASWLMDDNT